MPKFNRQQLADAVTVALADHRSEWEATWRRQKAEYENAQDVWIKKHGETWRLAALAIGRKLRAGKPIRRSDLPADAFSFNDRVLLFADKDPTDIEYAPPQSLDQLGGVLAVLDDEAVTTTTLRELGVNSEALRQALHHIRK